MKNLLKGILILFVCLGTNSGFAQEVDEEEFTKPSHDIGNEKSVPTDAEMGIPTFAGSGCPGGSVDVALSPDKKSISILFDEFNLLLSPEDPERRLRSSCNIIIPFDVPPGMTVSVVRLDYRGFNYIEKDPATITYKSSYFISGLKNNGKMTKVGKRKKTFMGPLDDEFILSSRIRNKKHRGSHCGKDIEFHINSEIIVRRKKSKSEVEAVIDSIDGSAQAGAKYYLNWEKCSDKKPKDKKKKDRPRKKRDKDRQKPGRFRTGP